MARFLEKWSREIAQASDEESRRRLLAHIGAWRAAHLGDVPALREAAGAMARLYALLHEHDRAIREARGLVSLCQTPPVSPEEELEAARALLRSLGGEEAIAAPKPRRRSERKRRDRGGEPPAAVPKEPGRIEAALAAAKAGRYREAEEALAGGRGPRTHLARAWIRLAWALAAPDAGSRLAGVQEVEAWLRQRLGVDRLADGAAPERGAAPPASAPAEAAPHPLEAFVGRPVPRRWRDRIRVLEAALAERPERADDLAALALEHHVAVSGEGAPAPWLATLVGHALATGEAPRTRAAIARLADRGVVAVALYAEAPFSALVAVAREAVARGGTFVGLRRGVLPRGELADRRVWTLRIGAEGGERLLAMAPEATGPLPGDLAARIGDRLATLCPRVALVAAGEGNAGLREAAAAAGAVVVDPGPPEVLAERLLGLEPPAAPAAPTPEEALAALLSDGVPEAGDLDEAIGRFQRVYHAFRVAGPVLDGRSDPDAPQARIAFLLAVDRVAPPSARVPEGTTWGLRLAAEGHGRRVLDGDTRYGGPGIDVVVDIARALGAAGLFPDRAFRGPTRRERRGDDVLSTLEGDPGGLWRLRIGDVEVAILVDLTPEGRVAATRLVLDERPRVVVVPVDGDLLSWWRSSGGADPIGWAGEEADDVVAAVRALTGEG